MNNFDTMEIREKRGVISSLDFAKEVVAIATVAIDVVTDTRSKELATAIAAMKLDEAVSKLFPEDPQEEKEPEKTVDLKQMLFNHAADSREPIPGMDIENNRTAEIRRSAKHTALLFLISDAGLMDEYHKWLDENDYSATF